MTEKYEEDENTLENKGSNELREAVAALDSRGQRNLGRLLSRTAALVPEVEAGGETVSTQSITSIRRSDGDGVTNASGKVMRAALQLAGVSPSHLANVLREGLGCRKHVVVKGLTRKLPDYALRLKYLELAHRLRGDLQQDNGVIETLTYEQRLRQVIDKTKQLSAVDAVNDR